MNRKENFAVSIEYHADDYGISPAQSERILNCHKKGALNGVSIMPNSDSLEACMELLSPFQKDVAVTIHLNLIEGCALCSAREIPLLTEENGIFRATFGNLLLHSFLPDRNAYREQLKKEIRAQIQTAASFLEKGAPLRLDGHAHYHMIPVVFDALMDVIREEHLEVSYIRIPREHPVLYLRAGGRFRDFSALNVVKVLILNGLARRNLRKYRDYLKTLDQKMFLGVFLSGCMYPENILPVLPEAVRFARKHGQDIELLAHPGGIYEAADIARLTFPDDRTFLTSPSRSAEAALFEAAEVQREAWNVQC